MRAIGLRSGNTRLRVVEPSPDAGRFARLPPERRSAAYDAIVREIGRRVDYVHRTMRDRGEILPEAVPTERDLTDEEVEELAWRVYTLSTVMRCSLVRHLPTLMLYAAEWFAGDDPQGWDAFCESLLAQ